jgi:uncharacterized protein
LVRLNVSNFIVQSIEINQDIYHKHSMKYQYKMMYYNILLTTTMIVVVLMTACTPRNKSDQMATTSMGVHESHGFDSLLAVTLGADAYGMSYYVMAFLKAGPNRDQDSVTRAEIQKGHMENIAYLARQGKLVLAGPFIDDGEYRGLFLFNVASLEEAKLLTESDPAVKAGRLIMELKPWYGSAAIKKVNELHNRIARSTP